ncbi:MAG: ABC transporter permease [Acidimicrobiia bacterium]|nr:ABC transporter permease [Acidimicrobiia bacterium]
MRHASAVFRKDLRQRLRDRTAVLVGLVLPVVLTVLIAAAFSREESFAMRLGITATGDTLSARVVVPGYAEDPVELIPFNDRAAASAAVESGHVDAAVVVGGPAPAVIVNGYRPVPARVARAIAYLSAEDAARAGSHVQLVSAGGKIRPLDYFAISMTILFLTFLIWGAVRSFQEEKEGRMLARLAATPSRPHEILAGKYGAMFALGLVQVGVLIAVSGLVFGVNWGQPLLVAVLALATVGAALGVASILVTVPVRPERRALIGMVSMFLLAVLGGQFFPPEGLPDVFDRIARFTPNGQALFGFTNLAALGKASTFGTIAEPLAVMSAVACVGILLGVVSARRAFEIGDGAAK